MELNEPGEAARPGGEDALEELEVTEGPVAQGGGVGAALARAGEEQPAPQEPGEMGSGTGSAGETLSQPGGAQAAEVPGREG